jgi:hypothetical protein
MVLWPFTQHSCLFTCAIGTLIDFKAISFFGYPWQTYQSPHLTFQTCLIQLSLLGRKHLLMLTKLVATTWHLTPLFTFAIQNSIPKLNCLHFSDYSNFLNQYSFEYRSFEYVHRVYSKTFKIFIFFRVYPLVVSLQNRKEFNNRIKSR